MELPAFLSKCQGPSVDWADHNIVMTAAIIVFNPLFWNIMARLELRTRSISRLCGGAHAGCVLLAATIIFLAALRTRRYQLTLYQQPIWLGLQTPVVHYTGAALMILGAVFTISSFLELGFYGTYLGDYFGIMMDHRVNTFPFNVMENPMYWGSVLEYVGYALWYGPSPAGLLLSVLLAVCYKIAIMFEGPYTEKIYSCRLQETEEKKDR